MNRKDLGVQLAAAVVAIGMLVAAHPAAGDTPAQGSPTPVPCADTPGAKTSQVAPPAGKQGSPPGAATAPKKTTLETCQPAPCTATDPPKTTPKDGEPPPCVPRPCACPTGSWDLAIAALFVIAVIGTVVAVGLLSRTSSGAGEELDHLRELVKSQLAREQDQNQAARAWGLQAFETLARSSRIAEPSPQAVFGVQPPTGPAQTLVQIFGRRFEPGLQVFVAGVLATDVTFVSPWELTAKVPGGTPGTRATVTVVWPAGPAAYLEAAFTYA